MVGAVGVGGSPTEGWQVFLQMTTIHLELLSGDTNTDAHEMSQEAHKAWRKTLTQNFI